MVLTAISCIRHRQQFQQAWCLISKKRDTILRIEQPIAPIVPITQAHQRTDRPQQVQARNRDRMRPNRVKIVKSVKLGRSA